MTLLETGTIAALAALVILFLIFRLESRIPIAIGLGLLVVCIIMVAIGNGAVAEQIAVYAYYFLVAGVLLLFVQLTRAVPRAAPPHSGKISYDITKTAKKRAGIRSTEIFRTSDQMMMAKVVQDELRQRLQSWSGTEQLRIWQDKRIQLLDTSVIICWFSEERSTAKALEVRQRILDGQVKGLIPDFGLSQVIQALSSNPRLSDDDLVAAAKSVKDIGLGISTVTPLMNEAAAKLAFRYKINISQALYITIANELAVELVTADEAFYRNTRQLRFVKFLGDLDEPEEVES